MIQIAWAIALALVAAYSVACTETARPEPATVVDSAGIQIVTNPPGSIEAAEVWSLSAKPVVEIGSGADPDVVLFRVEAVVPLDDGCVAVGMNGPSQALVFEQDGTPPATLGREGGGPGEFLYVGSVVPLGPDSLAVWDPDRRRMSVFTRTGDYVRELDLADVAPLSLRMASSGFVPSGLSYLLPSAPGSLVLFGEGMSSPQQGVHREELPSYRITSEGEELARFGPFPGIESYFSDDLGGGLVPFSARPHAAAMGDALIVGTAEAPEFRRYAPSGDLVRIVRWPDHDRTVEGPFLSRWSEMVEADRDVRSVMDRLPRAERFPAYEDIISTDTGEIWVGAYPGPLGVWPILPKLRMPARRWLVFDADGALAASVHTPEGFQPYAVREGRLWGVFTDELDAESVRAYEIAEG